MNPVHFSSASDNWETPKDFFAKVEAEFGPFDLDPCATAENAKAKFYWTTWSDGLAIHNEWYGKVWCNPPYGRTIGAWIRRAADSVGRGGKADLVVMLLPARPDTVVWHDVEFPHASEIWFIKGRLKFGKATHPAPFPSALVIFRRKADQ